MKLNTDTYYEQGKLVAKLQKLPGVKEVLVGDGELILVSRKGKARIDVMAILKIKVLVVDLVRYVRLTDINGLLALGQITKSEGQDETHIIGQDSDEE